MCPRFLMNGCAKTMVDHHDCDGSEYTCERDRKEVLFERQLHCNECSDQNRRDNRTETTDTRSKAHSGRADGSGVELASVSVGKKLSAEGGGADDEDHNEQKLRRFLVAHES